MKKSKPLNILGILGILLIFTYNSVLSQQKQHKHKNTQVFVDKDGDGYNDMAPDHDGDGIPNGLDPDWTKGNGGKMNYIDADGDGINDLIQNNDQTILQNGDMHGENTGESIINNNQERQKGHKRGKPNNK